MEICRGLLPFWNLSLPRNLSSKNSNSLKKYTQKNFENFSMVLEFHELEYHRKLDFTRLEYPKSDKSIHISKIVVDCNMVSKNVLFDYFRLKTLRSLTNRQTQPLSSCFWFFWVLFLIFSSTKRILNSNSL